MTEVELFPALDKLGRPIPQHYDVWLNGEVLLKATPSPFEDTRLELLRLGMPSNGVCIKPKIKPPTTTALDPEGRSPRTTPVKGRVFTKKRNPKR